MQIIECEKLYKELAEKNGCDFKLEWTKRVKRYRRLGSCWTKEKKITLQPVFVELNEVEAITNVILHEIAHALTPNHGHNKFWKRKAKSIGCDGNRFNKFKIIR